MTRADGEERVKHERICAPAEQRVHGSLEVAAVVLAVVFCCRSSGHLVELPLEWYTYPKRREALGRPEMRCAAMR